MAQYEARPTQDCAHAETWACSSFLGMSGETVSQGRCAASEELPLMALGSFPCGLGCFWMVEVGDADEREGDATSWRTELRGRQVGESLLHH